MVRLSSAVCAISGVWVFDSTVPFDFKKFSRWGICSKSDGTFGLSREKCTLSKTMLMTCWTPLPSWQPVDDVWGADDACGVAVAVLRLAVARTVPARTLAAQTAARPRRRGIGRMTDLSG